MIDFLNLGSDQKSTLAASQPQSITAFWPLLISHPAEGRRLTWPGRLAIYQDGISANNHPLATSAYVDVPDFSNFFSSCDCELSSMTLTLKLDLDSIYFYCYQFQTNWLSLL